MSTQETPLSAFFSRFTFSRYTCDPSNDPADEFERLCVARQWGSARREMNYAGYLSALEETLNQPVANFFRKYESLPFAQNLLADPEAEFDRLQAEIRKKFEAALEETKIEAERVIVETFPIVEFFKAQEVFWYTYGYGRPEKEFRMLMEAHKDVWAARERRKKNVATGSEGRKRWRASDKFKELQEGYYKAVEGQFDTTLDRIAASGKRGMRRDEVMVELYGVGKAPLSEKEAETALESVHVNIYDFIEVVDATISAATASERKNLIQLLSPAVRELNFPNDGMLATYSKCMDRVFPRRRAASDGTLILLLREISGYFDAFDRVVEKLKRVFEEEFETVRAEGRDAMRNLLSVIEEIVVPAGGQGNSGSSIRQAASRG